MTQIVSKNEVTRLDWVNPKAPERRKVVEGPLQSHRDVEKTEIGAEWI